MEVTFLILEQIILWWPSLTDLFQNHLRTFTENPPGTTSVDFFTNDKKKVFGEISENSQLK